MRRFLVLLLVSAVAVTSAIAAHAGGMRSGEMRSGEMRSGDVVYRIVEADWRDRIAFRDVVYEAEAAFLVVRISARNDGASVAVLHPPKLVHAEHGVYEASWKGWVLPWSFDRFEALVPGTERTFTLAFEVTRDDGYRLMESGGGEIEVRSDRPSDGDPMV